MKDELRSEQAAGETADSPFTLHPSPVHRIRLGSPWEVAFEGERTRHKRNFGRPRTLDSGDRVWLVCERIPGAADVTVNGELIGTTPTAGPFVADVTARLLARNVVIVSVISGEPLAGVALEIRTSG
jgi:hypothetical protein